MAISLVQATVMRADEEMYTSPLETFQKVDRVEEKVFVEKTRCVWTGCCCWENRYVSYEFVESKPRKYFNIICRLPWEFRATKNLPREVEKVAITLFPLIGPFIAFGNTLDRASETRRHFQAINPLKAERDQIKEDATAIHREELVAFDLAYQTEQNAGFPAHQAKVNNEVERHRQAWDNIEAGYAKRLAEINQSAHQIKVNLVEGARKKEVEIRKNGRQRSDVLLRQYTADCARNSSMSWGFSFLSATDKKRETEERAATKLTLDNEYKQAHAKITADTNKQLETIEKERDAQIAEVEEEQLPNWQESALQMCEGLQEREEQRHVARLQEIAAQHPENTYEAEKAAKVGLFEEALKPETSKFDDAIYLRRVMLGNKAVRTIGELGWTAALTMITAAAILRMFYLTNARPPSLELLPKQLLVIGGYTTAGSLGLITINELFWRYLLKPTFQEKYDALA